MHNIKINFDKIYQTIKSLDMNIFDEHGNVQKPGKRSQFSDLEVISLSLVAEYMSLDSENWLFKKIDSDYKDQFPFLIDSINFQSTGKFTDLSGGDYQVFVKDDNNCIASVSTTLTTTSYQT